MLAMSLAQQIVSMRGVDEAHRPYAGNAGKFMMDAPIDLLAAKREGR